MVPRSWKVGHGRFLELGRSSVVMGILNVTPDSFSDGGRHNDIDQAISKALRMTEDGATIIDIGGESTRPGAEPVEAAEEQARVIPIIRRLAECSDVLISVDTYRRDTAELAISAGAHIINDIWGLHKDNGIAQLARSSGAGLVIMHNGRDREKDPDVIGDLMNYLKHSLDLAQRANVEPDRIILDPGFGFGKTTEENFSLIRRFDELKELDHRWLVGTSRKRFIGDATTNDVDHRDVGTAATNVALRLKGASLFRVHDVAVNLEALRVADEIAS